MFPEYTCAANTSSNANDDHPALCTEPSHPPCPMMAHHPPGAAIGPPGAPDAPPRVPPSVDGPCAERRQQRAMIRDRGRGHRRGRGGPDGARTKRNRPRPRPSDGVPELVAQVRPPRRLRPSGLPFFFRSFVLPFAPFVFLPFAFRLRLSLRFLFRSLSPAQSGMLSILAGPHTP